MPTFRKVIYSGICICGHSYEDHHIGMVLNPEAYKVMGPECPQECEYFGWNEGGGLDESGEPHCNFYVDKHEPVAEVRDLWKGTIRMSDRDTK